MIRPITIYSECVSKHYPPTYFILIGTILKYSVHYYQEIPVNPLVLIQHIPKTELITTLVKVNTLLQPLGYRNIDSSRSTQVKCLKAILLGSEIDIFPEQLIAFDKIALRAFGYQEGVLLFTRGTCLYALNEILQSDIFTNENKTQYGVEERKGILDYLLICNENILNFMKGNSLSENIDSVDKSEYDAFFHTPFNQYNISVNILLKLYKSSFFLECLINDNSLKAHLLKYFKDKYGVEDIPSFFHSFLSLYLEMYDENLEMNFLKVKKDQRVIINILEGFSSEIPVTSLNHTDVQILDYLPIKKSPLYFFESNKKEEVKIFLVLDAVFLLEKLDSLFINDFWFDYLKSESDLKRTNWGDFIGVTFFESFIGEIVSNAFKDVNLYTIKMFDDLKLKISKKRTSEIADLYIRHKQKIAFIEVKSNFINMVDGYKSVTNIDEFNELNLKKFYKSFGLEQTLDTIKNFHFYKNHLNDKELDVNRKIHLYPIVLVNEPILFSGLFCLSLRLRFEEMLKNEGIQTKTKEHMIWPLVIMNVEEFQELEQSIQEESIDFFKFLDSYHSKTSNNIELGDMFYTIHDLINEKIESDKLCPERVRSSIPYIRN